MQGRLSSLKYTLILVAGIALVTALLLATRPPPKSARVEPPPLKVETIAVALHDFHPLNRIAGVLQPVQRAVLSFEVNGRLTGRKVEPGRKVAKGDVLLTLADGDFRDAVSEARARLAEEEAAKVRDSRLLALAERNRKLQEAEVKRQERLGSSSLASQTSLDAARQKLLGLEAEEARLRYSVDTADARLALQQSALATARRNLDRTQLIAPFDGTVNTVAVEVGDSVNARQTVMELVRSDRLELHVDVSGEVAAALTLGQEVSVIVRGDDHIGRIIALQQAPDAATFTHELRIVMDNPGLLPGTVADVILPLTPLDAVATVPVTAIIRDRGESFVYVVDGNRVRRRLVELGPREGGTQAVLNGLASGDVIVARNGAVLADGMEISL